LREYPTLEARHISRGARLYAHRNDMIADIGADYRRGVIAEIGVAFGDFSEIMLSALDPLEFVAIDMFTMHEFPTVWGRPTTETLGNKTHMQFYKERFVDKPVHAISGDSFQSMSSFPDAHFDLIYVDADHRYEPVKRDAYVADLKLKAGGTLIFNDYIMHDHIADIPYGVVQSVNELIDDKGYEVVGFALNRNMFCDIALRRVTTSQ
jgi:hypothetical protein